MYHTTQIFSKVVRIYSLRHKHIYTQKLEAVCKYKKQKNAKTFLPATSTIYVRSTLACTVLFRSVEHNTIQYKLE